MNSGRIKLKVAPKKITMNSRILQQTMFINPAVPPIGCVWKC
jgi:hypothetical protein